jgi:Glycosyltransferase family 25 (LPS biosynthesis protein)
MEQIPIYCINLDRRTDRWDLVRNQPGFKEFPQIERFSAVEGKDIDVMKDDRISLVAKRNILLQTRRAHEEISTKGAVGCYLSHVGVWERFMKHSSAPYMIVMEDDVELPAGSRKKLENFIASSTIIQDPSTWDLCILAPSRGLTERGDVMPDSTLVRLNKFCLTVFYMITRRGIERMMTHIFPLEVQIDGYMSICSTLRLIDVVAPNIPPPKMRLFNYLSSKSDIFDTNGCAICDVKTKFEKESVIIPKTTYWRYQAEEAILLSALAYGMYMVWSKHK